MSAPSYSAETPPTPALHRLSIAEAAGLIQSKRLSSVEYTQALIDRVDTFDPQINAFITPTTSLALEQAKAADKALANGDWKGPLHGVPFALKDIYDTASILTSGHSRVCIDRIPTADATTTAKLYAAGAVLLGKLATHEFAHGGPSFDLPWPPARNPWNTACFTGGSSSGSGAALAAGFVPAALGSDTGGSIRGPASWCGVSGLMPTFGLVSRAGVIPNSFSFDHCGPMARSIEDCAILLQAIAGFDAADAGSIRCAIPDYRAALSADLKGLRIGVLRHYWEEDQPASGDVCSALDTALDVLRGLGAQVENTRVRPLKESFDIKVIIAETEIFTIHLQALRERAGDFGWDFLQRALPACLFSASDYFRATREHRRSVVQMAQVFDRYDVLLTIGQGAAPRLDNHDPLNFWKKPNLFTPSNVAAGPAAVVCSGFSASGLPLGMQIIGRPFDDATVLRVGHAFQLATDWHRREPVLAAGAAQPVLAPIPIPTDAPDTDAKTRALCDTMAERAGLSLDDTQRILLYRAAPYALEMVARLKRDHGFDEAPANVFQFPADVLARGAR
ncbi:MAG: amidase [Proteobacteria bacterium]|nr:amidase [Burkholderiales bacterium]